MHVLLNAIGTAVFGAIIGLLARLVLPGKQNIGALMTVAIGIAGALIGYFLAGLLGVKETSGIDWVRWIISIAVAAVLVTAYGSMTGKKQS